MDTHGANRENIQVVRKGNTLHVGNWEIQCNLSEKGKAFIRIRNTKENVSLHYDAGKKEGKTFITDQVKGQKVEKALSDYLPEFEI